MAIPYFNIIAAENRDIAYRRFVGEIKVKRDNYAAAVARGKKHGVEEQKLIDRRNKAFLTIEDSRGAERVSNKMVASLDQTLALEAEAQAEIDKWEARRKAAEAAPAE